VVSIRGIRIGVGEKGAWKHLAEEVRNTQYVRVLARYSHMGAMVLGIQVNQTQRMDLNVSAIDVNLMLVSQHMHAY